MPSEVFCRPGPTWVTTPLSVAGQQPKIRLMLPSCISHTSYITQLTWAYEAPSHCWTTRTSSYVVNGPSLQWNRGFHWSEGPLEAERTRLVSKASPCFAASVLRKTRDSGLKRSRWPSDLSRRTSPLEFFVSVASCFPVCPSRHASCLQTRCRLLIFMFRCRQV